MPIAKYEFAPGETNYQQSECYALLRLVQRAQNRMLLLAVKTRCKRRPTRMYLLLKLIKKYYLLFIHTLKCLPSRLMHPILEMFPRRIQNPKSRQSRPTHLSRVLIQLLSLVTKSKSDSTKILIFQHFMNNLSITSTDIPFPLASHTVFLTFVHPNLFLGAQMHPWRSNDSKDPPPRTQVPERSCCYARANIISRR